jgi:peptide methionine sulfoxide reductase MsrB
MEKMTMNNYDNISKQEFSLSQQKQKEKPYDQKIRSLSTPELIQELATMRWHYALFHDKKKFEMACAVEMEIAR